MKFALLDNNKVEAIKGVRGVCPSCGSELIAKCGEVKVKHWAHKQISSCDIWWENETEWHRSWKNNFPNDWQEILLHDEQSGEKHIADVRTIHGLVIEFQHSKIEAQERISRENFYKNMVWVVDGVRLKGDYIRFLKGRKYFHKDKQGFFLVEYPETCFPLAWLESSVPVIFDFRGTGSIEDTEDNRNRLYCLFPKNNKREAVVVEISRESFIKDTINGEWFKRKSEPIKQSVNLQARIVIRRKEPTHYYDSQRGRLVKRWRF